MNQERRISLTISKVANGYIVIDQSLRVGEERVLGVFNELGLAQCSDYEDPSKILLCWLMRHLQDS